VSLNLIGLVAALAAFLGVWMGHVCVRKVESTSRTLGPPMVLAALIGFGLEVGAVLSPSPMVSGGLGILGMTVLWDVLELPRQARRVAAGHAPANPSNPRHARLLADGTATSVDWLAREPVGHPLRSEELTGHAGMPEHTPTSVGRRGA